MIGFISKAIRGFRRNVRGSSSVEFALTFPFLCAFLFGYGEVGTLATRAVMLERGLDIAIRDVRLGNIPRNAPAEFQRDLIKFRICENAFLLVDCEEELNIEMVAVPLGQPIPNNPPACIDRSEDPLEVPTVMNIGTVGQENLEIMLVRACLVVDPIFNIGGWLAGTPLRDINGDITDFAIFAQTAFINEPTPSATGAPNS